jgi:cyclomaltodextrinase
MAAWTEHVMWWHLYPLGFVGAPVRPAADQAEVVVHRLDRIEAWLDHVLELGLNGILLGPIFASSSHGYDTVDHFRIDARLGDERDFDRLVEEAHRRGIRVMLDGVFNHLGRAHPAFRALEAEGPAASNAGMFRVRWDGWRHGRPVDADVFEGHDSLVALDHSSPAVEDLVVGVMNHWLDRGADAWRLDAAYAVPPEFWARVLPRVRSGHHDAWFTGEVIHGDAAAIVRASTLDSLTQYELWQGIWHGIADRNLFELTHALQRHDDLLSTFVPSTFVGNHDVTRIASAIGAQFVPHALAILLTTAGVPSVYAGDEYAFTGEKEERLGGDDAVRPAFPSHPPDPDSLDAAARGVLEAHRALIALRRRHPWLHRAHSDVVHVDNTSLVLRAATDAAAVVTALNLGTDPVELPGAGATAVEAGDAGLRGSHVVLGAGGWAVLTG